MTTTRVTGRRVVQYVLDTALVGVLLSLLAWAAPVVVPGSQLWHPAAPVASVDLIDLLDAVGPPWGLRSVGALLLTVPVWAVVFVAVPLRLGRTPAMVLLGLRIVRVDGGAPSAVQHLVRALLLLVDGVAGGLLGWLVVVRSTRRQRIGDHVAGTLVARRTGVARLDHESPSADGEVPSPTS